MSQTQRQVVKALPPGRITVHNGTGGTLSRGTVVRATGGRTDGCPNVGLTTAPIADADNTISGSSNWLGILYEDIKAGEKGVAIIDGEIVEVTANVAVSVGDILVPDANGRVRPINNTGVGVPATGAYRVRIQYIVGKALADAAAGEKVKIVIDRALSIQSQNA